MRTRRQHSREFKVEAVRLVRERGVTMAQAGRDLDVSVTLLRKWAPNFAADPRDAFPGPGAAEAGRRRADAPAPRGRTMICRCSTSGCSR